MAPNDSRTNPPNVYGYRSRQLLSEYVQKNDDPDKKLSELAKGLNNPAPSDELPICIIGAGVTALYTAMIFESLGISYQIVDADTRERIGGRLFTYHFPNGGPYDYYDVGAMRFPKTAFMRRTFDLAESRNLKVKLIPYIVQMVEPANTWLFYNGARVNNQDTSVAGDPFNIKDHVTDPSLRTPGGVSTKVTELFQEFRDMFRAPSPRDQPPDIEATMKVLFEKTNHHTMRTFMLEKGMDPRDIHWCETLNTATGWYDRALTQVVLENLAFEWPATPLPGPEKSNGNVGWYCFDGGSATLPRAMFASLSEKAQQEALFKSPVTAISHDEEKEVMRISINGVQSPQEYSAVVSTVPLPRLSLMDLTGANIHDKYGQWSAIRELEYAPAVKIGIKFTTPWWEKLPQPIRGGQSYTDLPLRTIVYPSYPAGPETEHKSRVLIASYCRTEDAERFGALIHPDGTAEPELIDLVFRDLAAVHGVTVNDIRKYYRKGDYFAWDWARDPLTMGGYAFFGPGVYSDGEIYGEILKPAARGKLFFAGEATSSCHAWVAGALDSAWRAVNQYFLVNARKSDLHKKFKDLWGETEYWDDDSHHGLAEANHKLLKRTLVIALDKDGVVPEPNEST